VINLKIPSLYLIRSIQQLHPGIQIHIIRDSDFFFGSIDRIKDDQQELTSKEVNRIKVFYWNLPMIESYLFLDWCQRTEDPFILFLRDILA
jgi:hypothetical protein